MLEKITRFDQKIKIHCVLLSHELLSTKIYRSTTHQFTYFIGVYYLFQDNFKNAEIIKIQEVHQKIHAKQFILFYLNCFLLATHLNLKRLEKHD